MIDIWRTTQLFPGSFSSLYMLLCIMFSYGIESISLSSTCTVSTVCLPYLMAVQTECPQVINGLKTPDLWTTHYSAAPTHHSPQRLNDVSASVESMHFPADCPWRILSPKAGNTVSGPGGLSHCVQFSKLWNLINS